MKHVGVKCSKCKDVIFSIAPHDFHSCTCGAVTIDGGFHYQHVGWENDMSPPETIEVNIPDLSREEYYDIWNKSPIKKPYGIIKNGRTTKK